MRKKHIAAKTNFTTDYLPHTRLQVFFDCIKVRPLILLLLGVITALCMLPLETVTLLSRYMTNYIDPELSDKDRFYLMTLLLMIEKLIDIPCYVILAAGLAGVMRIIRNLCYGDFIFFRQDFFFGIKSNGKNYTLAAFCLSLFMYVAQLVSTVINVRILNQVPYAINIIIFLPVTLWIICYANVYETKFFSAAFSAFGLYSKTLPVSLVAIIISVVPSFFEYLSTLLSVVLSLVFWLLSPVMLLGWQLYCCSVFDKHFNREHFPSIYRKGLFSPENNK